MAFKILRSVPHYFLITLLTILWYFVIPLILLTVFCPVYLWRLVVRILKIPLRPDLDRMVSPRSAAMAQDKCLEPNPKCNLVVLLSFEGKITPEELVTEFGAGTGLNERYRNEVNFPEFCQYYEKWLGFLFWKWETDYTLKDHFMYYNPDNPYEPVTAEDMVKIELELVHEPYPPKYSPWKVLLIPNYIPKEDDTENNNNGEEEDIPKKSMICFKLHHGLADGFSILNLLMKEIGKISDNDVARAKFIPRSTGQKILDASTFIFKSPFQFIQQLIENFDQNEWRVDETEMSKTWFSVQTLVPLKLDYIKGIKNGHGVCFTSIMIEAITGGIRNYLLKRGRPIPEKMSAVVPFPMPGFDHTTKLRNFFSYAFLKFPIGLATPQERLGSISKNIRTVKKSSTLLTNFLEIPVVARLLPSMMKPLLYNRYSTCILSNFPGPNDPCQLFGKKVLSVGFCGGLLIGNTGLGFMMISYNGTFTLRINGNQSIFNTQADLDDLLQLVLEELETLRKCGRLEV